MTWFLLLWSANPNGKNPFFEQIVQFYKLWPAFQWISSLVFLVAMYWLSGYMYNKYLSEQGGWMDTKTRIVMIIVDLILNFSLGIYYMNHRDTFIGMLMIRCPVFCSPAFWIVELICFYVYFKYVKANLAKSVSTDVSTKVSTNVTSSKVRREEKS